MEDEAGISKSSFYQVSYLISDCGIIICHYFRPDLLLLDGKCNSRFAIAFLVNISLTVHKMQ